MKLKQEVLTDVDLITIKKNIQGQIDKIINLIYQVSHKEKYLLHYLNLLKKRGIKENVLRSIINGKL